jgi:hypothetical protein
MTCKRKTIAALAGLSMMVAVPAARAEGECTGRVIIGDPRFRGDETPKPGGQAVDSGAPVQIRQLAVVGGDLHAHTLYELWMVPDVKKPSTIRRYAGVSAAEEKGTMKYKAGACAEARFPQLSGLAAGPGGSVIVTDRIANIVARVDKPGAEGCTVTTLAGPEAKLKAPYHPAVGADGTVYFLEDHNKVRRVAGDKLELVAALPSAGYGNDGFNGMVALKDKLYLVFLESRKNSVVELDPASGKHRVVHSGNGEAYPPLKSSVVPGLGGIASDGERLYVSGRAWIWSLTPDGKLEMFAGSGKDEFKPAYDIKLATPAKEIVLSGNASNISLAGLPGGRGLLFRGRAGYYNNSYVMQIDCAK